MIVFISTLFFLLPFISLPVIVSAFLLDNNFKHKKLYMIFLAISASILMFYFTPDSTKDLYRYYIMMGKLSNLTISDFLIYLSSRTEPLSNIYFYIFSKIGNYNYIMIMTTLLSYGLIFYVLFDHQKKVKLYNQDFNIIVICMFAIFYLVDDISGIRFCIGRILFFLALYLDLYKNKKSFLTLILYLITPLIHSSCIILVFIRLMMLLLKNKFNLKTLICMVLLSISPQIIIKMASILSNVPVLSSLGSKAEAYLSLNAGFYPMFVLQIVIMILLLILLLYLKKHDEQINEGYVNFVLVILFVGLLFIQCTSISTRFIRVAEIFSLPILMDYLKTLKKKNKIIVYIIILIISGVSVIFQISHLTFLISYGELFENGIFKNVIGILFQ